MPAKIFINRYLVKNYLKYYNIQKSWEQKKIYGIMMTVCSALCPVSTVFVPVKRQAHIPFIILFSGCPPAILPLFAVWLMVFALNEN